jgi:hypothetical protein
MIADFGPVAWWYTKQKIGRDLRAHFESDGDLPPQLLFVEKLDAPPQSQQSRQAG